MILKALRRRQRAKPKPIDASLPLQARIGISGENAATRFYYKNGFDILHRNIRVEKSEIDLIVQDKEFIVFCEVKSTIGKYGEISPYGRPASAVDKEKQRLLILAASNFAKRYKKYNKQFRFDVVEVYLTPDLKVEHLHHIRSAFTK